MNSKTKTLTEAAILIAAAQVLSYISISPVANGGSIDCAMLPIILFAVRHGAGWGTGAGLIYGVLQYVLGHGIAIDWTTILADYLIAYALLGFGAGLCKGRERGVYLGTLLGGGLRLLIHYIVGAVVWGKWMPEEFLGITMTTPWFYSILYNAIYMIPCILIVLVLFHLLSRNPRIHALMTAEDLR